MQLADEVNVHTYLLLVQYIPEKVYLIFLDFLIYIGEARLGLEALRLSNNAQWRIICIQERSSSS